MEFAFKHMDRSEAVESAAQEAFTAVLDRYAESPINFKVLFSVNRKFNSIHISTHLRDGHQIELEQGEDNMYKAIELISDRLGRELSKQKSRHKAARHKDSIRNMPLEETAEE